MTLKKIGPMWSLEGNIVLFPTIAEPLPGYTPKNLPNLELLFNEYQTAIENWWNSFPDCCDYHKRISSANEFAKQDYSFAKNQLYSSLKYFIYCMEVNLDKEDWFDRISQYYEYLVFKLGNPGWGDHLLDEATIRFIEKAKFVDFDFNDDMKLLLIDFISPSRKEIENRRNNHGDLSELYDVFQKWLLSMPNIGEISEIKTRLTGKVPLNLFLTNTKINMYLGIASSRIKSNYELINDLSIYSKTLLFALNNSIKDQFLEDNGTVINLISERLRIKQDKLFLNPELPSIEFVIEWLNIWIEYFTDLKKTDLEDKINTFINHTNSFLNEYTTGYNLLDTGIAELRQSLSLYLENISIDISNRIKIISNEIIASIESNSFSEEDLIALANEICNRIEATGDAKAEKAIESMKKSQIGVKSKLQIAVPIFFFTKYITEFEMGRADKMPRGFAEFKKLLFEDKQT